MAKNTGKRRKNDLTPREIDIATEPIELETLSYDEAVKRFMADAERRGLRPDTISYYKMRTGLFRRWLVTQEKTDFISRVMRHDIDNYVEYLQNERVLSNGAINTTLRAIRALFGFLKESKFIRNNPMKGYPLLKIRSGNIEAFNMKQVRQLLNATDKRTFTGVRDYTYMLLLLETGLRLSESAAILVEDVKLSEGVIFVRHTKNNFHRYVPIQAKMKEQLRRYLKLRGTCETDHLFVTIDGEAMQRATMQRLVAKYGRKAGIKGVRCSPHTLRHTFAKMSVMNGAGVFELQKILGHSTMEMVRVYVNLYSSDVYEKHKDFSPLKDL
ncbi:tyrosine-type recombinase/integrase [Lederbergia citri]|uniref:Tyrosine-type recombinase/integrase n=1 Tax=Lederbergia citri TaxID=2833580 RepID=A0A942TBG8_9BACI|nr:tyrosine-type recombinase/integrase [Lederbergia citri]MBS4193464.1 tyrosine-type recombinase/integrase [Lederbergia citri]